MPRKVLIVDDEPNIVTSLTFLMNKSGFETSVARDGDEALTEVERFHPDLVLLDVMMPEVDGWEMLRRVQERHGVGAIPVIMFSGKVDEQAAEEATSRGAQAFIGKPFNPQELIDQTKQLLPT
jgi:DNA-binding response OmpR family regulator